jgi:Zn ribbon nucleic-acid-binding protein
MGCPKCKAKIGLMEHEITLEFAVVQVTRCVICGYWSQPYQPYNRKSRTK